MARTGSLDRALTALVASAVRGQVRDTVAPLIREVRKLQRRMESIRSRGTGSAGKRRGGRRAKYERCQVDGCRRDHLARGFCLAHYNRYKQQGRLDELAARVEAGKSVPDIRLRRGRPPGSGRAKGKRIEVRARKAASAGRRGRRTRRAA